MKPRIYQCSKDGIPVFIDLNSVIAIQKSAERTFIYLRHTTFMIDQSYGLVLEAWRDWSTT